MKILSYVLARRESPAVVHHIVGRTQWSDIDNAGNPAKLWIGSKAVGEAKEREYPSLAP